jgi:hypothetical protein
VLDRGNRVHSRNAVEELAVSSASVVEEYARKIRGQGRVSVEEKVTSLAYMFNLYLSQAAAVNAASMAAPYDLSKYRLHLIVAGIDDDGKFRIGSASLISGRDSPNPISSTAVFTVNTDVIEIGDSLVERFAGYSDVARMIFMNPGWYEDDPILKRYSMAAASNTAASLPYVLLRDIESRILEMTACIHPIVVGGRHQFAVVERQGITHFEQTRFPDPPSPGPIAVSRVFNVAQEGGGVMRLGPHTLFTNNLFKNCQLAISPETGYFFHNLFDHCTLTYDGGVFYFGKSNGLQDCDLVIGPHAFADGQEVRYLSNDFHWRSVTRQ